MLEAGIKIPLPCDPGAFLVTLKKKTLKPEINLNRKSRSFITMKSKQPSQGHEDPTTYRWGSQGFRRDEDGGRK